MHGMRKPLLSALGQVQGVNPVTTNKLRLDFGHVLDLTLEMDFIREVLRIKFDNVLYLV